MYNALFKKRYCFVLFNRLKNKWTADNADFYEKIDNFF